MYFWVTVSIFSFLALKNKCTSPALPQVCSVWALILALRCFHPLFLHCLLSCPSVTVGGLPAACPTHSVPEQNSDTLKLDLHIEYPLRSRPLRSSSKTLPAYFLLPSICLYLFAQWRKQLCGLCLSRNCPLTVRGEHCGDTVAHSHLCNC